MSYFTHRRFIGLRCCGCGKYLWDLQAKRRMGSKTMLPVCAEANLAFIGDKNG